MWCGVCGSPCALSEREQSVQLSFFKSVSNVVEINPLCAIFTFLCFLGQEEINREPKAEEPFTLGQKGCVHKKVSAIRPGTLPRSALPRLLGLPAVALRAPVTVLILLMEIWEQQHWTWGETGGGK